LLISPGSRRFANFEGEKSVAVVLSAVSQYGHATHRSFVVEISSLATRLLRANSDVVMKQLENCLDLKAAHENGSPRAPAS
jgi:hypothetical protein